MNNKVIEKKIEQLQGSLRDNKLRENAKLQMYDRIFVSHKDNMIHISSDDNGYPTVFWLLCKDNCDDWDGIVLPSNLSLVNGSTYFNYSGKPHKLCPKCFKYITPVEMLLREANNKRVEIKALLMGKHARLVNRAIELEKAAKDLKDGTVEVNPVEAEWDEYNKGKGR